MRRYKRSADRMSDITYRPGHVFFDAGIFLRVGFAAVFVAGSATVFVVGFLTVFVVNLREAFPAAKV